MSKRQPPLDPPSSERAAADHSAQISVDSRDLAPADAGTPTDEERQLVARLLAGDEAAFETLVASHHGPMLRFARIFVSRADVAEEVVQETWLALLRGLAAFEGRSSLKTWLFHILANRARTRATREGRIVPFADLLAAEDRNTDDGFETRFTADGRWSEAPAAWQDDTPEALLLRREVMDQLEAALETLPPSQRTVVTLRDVEGFSSQEVCNVLQISETNQRVLLHRGRTRLRRDLAQVLGPAERKARPGDATC